MVHPLLDRPTTSPSAPTSAAGFAVAPFTLTLTHPTTGVTVVELTGELDLATSPTLDRCLQDALRDQRSAHLILNMSQLSFCGVAGLRSLLTARELARQEHTGLRLVPGRRIDRLLRLTQLHAQFLTYPDLPTALPGPTLRHAQPLGLC